MDLFPNIKVQLKSLKYDLTFRMLEYKGASKLKAIQYQLINQCFRMVGSLNDKNKQQELSGELLPVKRTEKKYKIFPASS